jgi:tRNA (cmo5U34)-methyltransferase
MPNQEQAAVFNEERAATYDERFARLAPLRDTLHLLTRLILADLPVNVRILCIGVGTGLELIYLAREFPSGNLQRLNLPPQCWKFAARKQNLVGLHRVVLGMKVI